MDGETVINAWLRVGRVEDIPRQGARVVTTQGGDIAVFRTRDDQIFALDDRCPHKQGTLSQGIVHGTAVTCPLHNWVIDLASGEAAAPDRGCVRRIATRVEDGKIYLDLAGIPRA